MSEGSQGNAGGTGGEAGAGNAGGNAAGAGSGSGAAGAGASGHGEGAKGGQGGSGTGNGAASGDWRDGISEDLRASPALKDIADVDSLAKQFVDQGEFLGNAIRVPGADASTEAKEAFNKKLQEKVPDLVRISDDDDSFKNLMQRFGSKSKPDDYTAPKFDNMPEGMQQSPMDKVLRDAAVKNNLTDKQFQGICSEFTQVEIAKANEFAETHTAEMKALDTEWGYAFDQKKADAIAAAKATKAPEAMIEAMEKGSVRAEVYRWMNQLAGQLGEDFMASDAMNRGGEKVLGKAEAQAQYDEIMNNKEHAYWKAIPGSDEKVRAMGQMTKLKEIAMGKGSRDVAITFG